MIGRDLLRLDHPRRRNIYAPHSDSSLLLRMLCVFFIGGFLNYS
jgi:hypothetical protein